MDTESIFKRIIDIKKISVQLKQSTEDPHAANTDLIKGILKLGRQLKPMRSNAIDDHHQLASISQADQIMADQRSNKNQSSQLLGLFTNAIKSEVSEGHGQNSMMGGDPSMVFSKSWQQQLTPAQQIIQLKHQNTDLQEQIKHLQQRLKKLEELQKQEKQQEWKDGLPYFELHVPRIKIFYTKLSILEKDFDKIDYSDYSVDLTLERIILNQLSQPGASGRPPKNISLILSQLKQVSYHTSKQNKNALPFSITQRSKQLEVQQQYLVVYYFKYSKQSPKSKNKKGARKSSFFRQVGEDKIKQKQQDYEIVQTLFMKFERQDDYKEWDLGVFINYKIVEDLGKNDMKLSYYSSMNNSALAQENQAPQGRSNKPNDANNQNFKHLLDKFGSKNNSNEKNNQHNADDQQNSKKITNYVEEQKGRTIEQYLEEMHGDATAYSNLKKLNSNVEEIKISKAVQSPIQKREKGTIKIVDQSESPTKLSKVIPERGSFQQIINKERSDTSHFGQHQSPLSPQEEKSKQNELQKLEAQQAKKQKILEAEEQKKKQKERMEAMKKMEYELSIKRARESLRKGYFLTKYAKNALSPYQKRVYLNEDGKRLCWQDVKKSGDPKWILMSDITNIKQGDIGKGVEQHLSLKKISKKGCFVAIYLNSKDRQTLQFGCEDQLVMEQFCKYLQLYRDNLL